MENFFVIIILMSGIGVWYFAKKRPNKKYRNFSIGLLLLSFILFYIVSPKQKEENVFKPIVSSIEKKRRKKQNQILVLKQKLKRLKKMQRKLPKNQALLLHLRKNHLTLLLIHQ